MRPFLNLYTHDGLFHADDVFATALLSLMAEEIHVTRGSDLDLPADDGSWIIFDIGGGELDHHTPENKERNGTHPNTNVPYAACGLVWRKYYREILAEMDCPERWMDNVYRRLESSLILGIDAEDNGYNPVSGIMQEMPYIQDAHKAEIVAAAHTGFTVSQMVKDYNPPWNSDMDYYEAFMDAVAAAKDIVINRIDSIISSMEGRDYILRAIDYSANHLLILDEFAPWEGILYNSSNPKARDIWYVISPALRGGWNIQCALSDSDDRTSYRHPLPAAWYGLRYEELQKVSGIKTAIFCHPSGFLAGAQTQEDILAMASIAMSQ